MKKIAAVLLVLSVLSPVGMRGAFADEAVILSRLNAIEKKQDRILAAMESLSAELNMIKIRVSSQ